MKSNPAWHSGLFTSDLPTAKILLKIWRGFGSLGWAAAAQLKLFCLRKLINDCCHERWRRGNLGSSARCWGRWSQTFQERGSSLFYTPGGEDPWADSAANQSELRFYLAAHVRYWVLPSFCESSKALGSSVLGAENGPTWPCSADEWSGNDHIAKKKWKHLKSLWSVQPRKDCRDRYWQIGKRNS